MNSTSGQMKMTETEPERAAELRAQAEKCRRLTSSVLDRRTYDALTSMAAECEAEAERLARTG